MSGHTNFAPIGHNLPPVQGGVPGPAAPQPQPPAEVEPPVADAMRCFEDENGNSYVAWNPLNDAGEAIKEALEAQEALSTALAKHINSLPSKATAEQQAALEEAMLQCDRRISEIETIVLQVTEIAERHLDGQEIDEATQARLARKLVDLAGEQSLRMHDRTRALEALHAGLDPLVRKLDAYAAHGHRAAPLGGTRPRTLRQRTRGAHLHARQGRADRRRHDHLLRARRLPGEVPLDDHHRHRRLHGHDSRRRGVAAPPVAGGRCHRGKVARRRDRRLAIPASCRTRRKLCLGLEAANNAAPAAPLPRRRRQTCPA